VLCEPLTLSPRGAHSRPLLNSLEEIGSQIHQSARTALFAADTSFLDQLKPNFERMERMPRAVVTILSGHSVLDLRGRIGLEGLYYVGDHGLQISGPGIEFTEPEAGLLRMALEILAAEVRSRVETVRGARVETRTLTCSVDLRDVSPRRRGQVRRAVASAVFEVRDLFRCQENQFVCELRPNVEWSQASAIRWILNHTGGANSTAIFIGEGFADEEVFRSLTGAITIKVGDPQRTSAAYWAPDVDELLRFLAWTEVLINRP